MRMKQLNVRNYKGLRDVSIPLSHFGCLIGENNSGKSSFLQAVSLFFSGKQLAPHHYFDPSRPIRIEIVFEEIGNADMLRLAEEHRTKVSNIVRNGRLALVRQYDVEGKSSLLYSALMPTEERFLPEKIAELVKQQRTGSAFAKKVVAVFPELKDDVDGSMDQGAMKEKIQNLADSMPADQKAPIDYPLPTGIDKSIIPMLPDRIYIPAVKDLSDDIKTAESTPFGKILGVLLRAIEPKLPDAQKMFQDLNSKLNRIFRPDGTIVDERLEEVKLIESTVEKYVHESFAPVGIRITIPPPELKTVFSAARIYANDGVDGAIESKGDGLRRAIVFSILRTYVELSAKLGEHASHGETGNDKAEQGETDQGDTVAPPSYLLLFEEPELFLHPKAQGILFNALKVFAQSHHVLVTTHSPMFFGPNATETFVRLRKTADTSISNTPFAQAQHVDLARLTAKDQFQIICFEHNNAAFFADTVVLVEGDSDYVLFPHVAKTLDPAWDVSMLPVCFARITGKGNIRRYREFFKLFSVRVPVISDLDLLLEGFQHIDPSEALKSTRDALLKRVDELIVPDEGGEPSNQDARKAHASGELRHLWKEVCQKKQQMADGKCSPDDLTKAVEDFFAWERKSARLDILRTSRDPELLKLKWQLLEMLRQVDVYVLEKGVAEEYYPDCVVGPDKPSKAQDFCRKVFTRDAILNCCSEQECEREGKIIKDKEFNLIFRSIFCGR